jgi:hypothetical protein
MHFNIIVHLTFQIQRPAWTQIGHEEFRNIARSHGGEREEQQGSRST